MINKKYFFILLYCLFSTSAYGEELTDYTWQQESASCIININCIIHDNEARDNRKKCIRSTDNEELQKNILVVGDSCSVGKETAEDVGQILSVLSASVQKSFSEIEVDFDSAKAFHAAVLYVTVNKDGKNKKTADKKDTEQQKKDDIVPVLLVRFTKDLYFDFNSSELKETGLTITQHFVHDVLATAFGYKNITVVGHADSVGTDQENMILSKERSDVIVAKIQEEISRTGSFPNAFLIESLGVGETQPIEHLDQEKKSAANRRVEIFLSPSSIALHRAEKYLQCLYRNKAGDKADEDNNESKNESDQAECFSRYMMLQTE